MTPSFPLIGIGSPGTIPSLLSSVLPEEQSFPQQGQSASVVPFGGIGQAIKGAGQAIQNSFLSSLFGYGGATQYLTGIVGLLLIAAGIFLFRPVRETVITAGKTAGKIAEIAA